MLHQDETDKPLIAIWIPEAMEWSMLGSNTGEKEEEEVEESFWTHTHTYKHKSEQKANTNPYCNPRKLFIYNLVKWQKTRLFLHRRSTSSGFEWMMKKENPTGQNVWKREAGLTSVVLSFWITKWSHLESKSHMTKTLLMFSLTSHYCLVTYAEMNTGHQHATVFGVLMTHFFSSSDC